MKKSILASLLAVVLLLTGGVFSQVRAQDVSPDPKAVELLNNFMKALTISDFEASIKAAIPYMHKTLLNASGKDITPDLRRFGFKKANTGAPGYELPVNVTRVRKTGTTQVGFGPTAEAGAVYDYFIGKKESTGGMPAPVKIFFPASGGAPSIYYIGSI